MKKIIFLTLIVSFISGCAAIKLNPNAKNVIVTPEKPDKDCKYLGSVSGDQGNSFTGEYTSNKNLEIGAMNDLKNNAAALGANYVQLITNRAASDSNGQQTSNQTSVSQVGNAFFCKNK
ncbi:hypothetical protein CF386_10020 [Paraphotobacterium marinum]|uniref:DUF4156 domain-containing protein n=1 Tax=Paraphotobacterium marinum TaxID=1755811 RepID=A0A220VI04_9GAMM|nr:hypothetical protein CF386_10020 [Paraphotobacterium marinum]